MVTKQNHNFECCRVIQKSSSAGGSTLCTFFRNPLFSAPVPTVILLGIRKIAISTDAFIILRYSQDGPIVGCPSFQTLKEWEYMHWWFMDHTLFHHASLSSVGIHL